MPRLLVSQAAERLGCSTSTVRRLIRSGALRATRWDYGGWYYVDSESVERLVTRMADMTQTSASTAQRDSINP